MGLVQPKTSVPNATLRRLETSPTAQRIACPYQSPASTIKNHVFAIDIDLFTLLASDMMALGSLSNLQSIGLRGSPS